MRQLVARGGKVFVEEVPAPMPSQGEVLVRNITSSVSIGTERAILTDSGRGAIARVRRNPMLLKQAFGVLKSGGLRKTIETYETVMSGDLTLGYSSCGEVIGLGDNVTDLVIGDIVACGGSRKANHAEVVAVPRNLVTQVQEGISPQDASLAAIGSVAIHGLRRSQCDFGEAVAIIGLGLIGVIAARVAACSGMKVMAYDPDNERVTIARKKSGITGTCHSDEFHKLVMKHTDSHGADAVLICAATEDSKPIDLAMQVVRNEGRVVLVGTADIRLDRKQLFDSEAQFSVSRSYGPGRYDSLYEEKGIDYPYDYVRWTENRNMAFFLDLIKEGQLIVSDLISEAMDITHAPIFFEKLVSEKKSPIAAVFTYGDTARAEITTSISMKQHLKLIPRKLGVGLIGAGVFAQSRMLPILASIQEVQITGICSRTSVKSKRVGRKWGAKLISTNPADIISSDDVSLVIITTPHNLHARQVVDCLETQKSVFVEKPLAISKSQLDLVEAAQRKHNGFVMVGFNRRYSPHAIKAKAELSKCLGPKIINYEVFAQKLPANHWVNDPEIGGGRLIGEGCHFLDLIRYFIGRNWRKVAGVSIPVRRAGVSMSQDFIVSVDWSDGSFSTLQYITIGANLLPKERVTIHADGKTIILSDFKELQIIDGKSKSDKLKSQDKGHREEIHRLVKALKTEEGEIQEFDDAVKSTLLTLEAQNAINRGEWITTNHQE